ncbi:phosphotransferase [uncultured Ferrimonas sp.]|uniref:aminoglycoside phosphotransferase family protein n=1 Tax=uncultured Ferrimonas sp. TaxID=432640 RepID=UPI0026232147|nr:phosphotransferase [uncultured Ferrimonas sp.]
MTADLRAQSLHRWLEQNWQQSFAPPQPIFADASFRRYFRYQRNGRSEIAMDAPPQQEDCRPFVAMTQALTAAGLPVPQLLAQDLEQGFLCLSDLGDTHLYQRLIEPRPQSWYRQALAMLPTLAQVSATEQGPLPAYSAQMLRTELTIFPQWLLQTHLKLPLPACWQASCDALVASALAQPQVAVHRDFHSRNLMVVAQELALIDYQGAVIGPISYDPVSLLRDCYLHLDEAQLQPLLAEHRAALVQAQLLSPNVSAEQFGRWFDLMGMQRHLKAAGIFARLHHRDGKSGYLADLPRVLDYLISVGQRHPDTLDLANWLAAEAKPRLAQAQP